MDPEELKARQAAGSTVVQAGILLARADTQPATFNAETREVDVVMGSGVAVVRAPWFEEPYAEELSMDPAHVRLGRLQSGRAPLLDSHQRYELENQLGVVSTARLEDGKLVGRVRFSRRPEVAGIVQDVADGILGNLSLGYRVHTYLDVTTPTDAMRRLRAVDWEPMECSLVTVPADPTSEVRTAADSIERASNRALVGRAGDAWQPLTINGRGAETKTMDPEQLKAQEAARAAAANTPPTTNTPLASEATTAAAPAADQARAAALELERSCAAEAARLADTHGLGLPWVRTMLARKDLSVALLQRAALEELAQRSNQDQLSSHVQMGATAEDKTRQAVEGALQFRMGVDARPNAAGAPMAGMRLTRMAEEFWRARGVNTNTLSPTEFANLCQKGTTGSANDPTRGLMATGDFAQLLANVQSKAMRKRYEATPQTWLAIARRSETADFKQVKRIQLSQGTSLKQVNEHGEFERGFISDQAENYGLKTQGIVYGFTRQAFLNDDLGELNRMTERMGARAADRRSDLAWLLVTGNPVLADTVAWFHGTHGNLQTGGGSPLAEASLAIALAAMRKQVDAQGNYLSIQPRILAVPPELEVTAKKLTTVVTPNISSSVNVFQGMFEQVIVEPRLATSATHWFLFANPNQVDVLEYLELTGQSGPQVMVRNGFDIDGVEYRVHDDFAVAPLEYVSAYKSAGA